MGVHFAESDDTQTQSKAAIKRSQSLNGDQKKTPRAKKDKASAKAGNCACCECSSTPLWREGKNGNMAPK